MDDRAKCPDQLQALDIDLFFDAFEQVSSSSETLVAIC